MMRRDVTAGETKVKLFAAGIQTGLHGKLAECGEMETLRFPVGKVVRPEGLEPSTL